MRKQQTQSRQAAQKPAGQSQEKMTKRQDQDLSQGSETLDDKPQEDERDHSDNGRGQRGVLNR
jgi:hypothetical protein